MPNNQDENLEINDDLEAYHGSNLNMDDINNHSN